MSSSSLWWLNQAPHSSVASSTASELGGFNLSSQHLLLGGMYGATRRVAKADDRSRHT